MSDWLIQTGLGNAGAALCLALIATAVGAGSKRPQLAWLLWLLVLVKLVTPPLYHVPLAVPAFASVSAATRPTAEAPAGITRVAPADRPSPAAGRLSDADPPAAAVAWAFVADWTGPIWLLGTTLLAGVSLVRVGRFHRLLLRSSVPAGEPVLRVARDMSHRLGLRRPPVLLVTSARISPLVWWVGGRIRVVIPRSLLDGMERESWQWVIAHELAHIRRRDYLVRWLEWLACLLFWWNPVVWWAQRNLRVCEELCCDGLVLSCLGPARHCYADSILKAVESLVFPAHRPPAMASEINSGGSLEQRVVMIMSGNIIPNRQRLMQGIVLPLALVVFPIGLALGQDHEKVRSRLQKSVELGHLSQAQADAMMDTLKKTADRGSGSERDQAADASAAKAADAGRIPADAANRRLDEQRDASSANRDKAGEDRWNARIQELNRAAAELEKKAAGLSAERNDLHRQLTEIRKMLTEIGSPEARARRLAEIGDWERAAAEMKKGAADGVNKQADLYRKKLEQFKTMADAQPPKETFGWGRIADDSGRAAEDVLKRLAEDQAAAGELRTRLLERLARAEAAGLESGPGPGSSPFGEQEERLREVRAKILAALESGSLSLEDANAKLAGIQAALERSGSRPKIRAAGLSDEAADAFARRLKEAVEAGKLTSGEAESRWLRLEADAKDRARAAGDFEAAARLKAEAETAWQKKATAAQKSKAGETEKKKAADARRKKSAEDKPGSGDGGIP